MQAACSHPLPDRPPPATARRAWLSHPCSHDPGSRTQRPQPNPHHSLRQTPHTAPRAPSPEPRAQSPDRATQTERGASKRAAVEVMESGDAAAAGPSRPAIAAVSGQAQAQELGCVADPAAAAAHYFAARAAAGLVLTDREHLSDLEHKLLQARLRFQDLMEEKKCQASKGCGCGCCPHDYARPRNQQATSIRSGPDTRSISETSNHPKKPGRQHFTRSVRSLSSSHHRHQQPQPQPQQPEPHQQKQDTAAEHGSPNSEGLLLAVDKFLSMK